MPIQPGQSWDVHERGEPIRNLNAESIAGLAPEDVQTINLMIGPQIEALGYPLLEP